MGTQEYNYSQIAPKIKQVLRRKFSSQAVVKTEQGYQGRVRVTVIASQLNGIPERQKQDTLWELFHAELPEECRAISMVMAYGTDEL